MAGVEDNRLHCDVLEKNILHNSCDPGCRDLSLKRRRAHPYLGIRWQTVTPRLARACGLPVEWGVFISEMDPEGPAAREGRREGDIITRIGRISLDEDQSFINALFNYEPGETVTVEVLRAGQRLEVEATLGETRIGE